MLLYLHCATSFDYVELVHLSVYVCVESLSDAVLEDIKGNNYYTTYSCLRCLSGYWQTTFYNLAFIFHIFWFYIILSLSVC